MDPAHSSASPAPAPTSLSPANLQIWFDGKFVHKEDARISVYDHGLLYGDGVFEGIRQYNGRIFEKDAHLKRLFESAQGTRLKMNFTFEQLSQALEDTVKINNFKDCYIRLVCTRGPGTLGISPLN